MIQHLKKIKSFLLVVIFICLLIFIAFALLGPFSKILVMELQVEDRLKVSRVYIQKEKEILGYLDRYKGKLLWRVDLKNMVYKIQSMYAGTQALIHRRFPNRLIVVLTKKNSFILLLKEGGSLYSVSSEGEIGIKVNSEELLDFPILRGEVFWNDLQLRKKVISILFAIPKSDADFCVQNISEIFYDKAHDSFLFNLIYGSFVLEFKGIPELEKIKNVEFVLNYLNQRKVQGSRIDARVSKKIIVKNRD